MNTYDIEVNDNANLCLFCIVACLGYFLWFWFAEGRV